MAAHALELQQQPAQLEYVEQNASAMQQSATARIQSSYLIAMKRTRDYDVARDRMLKECQRPDFCVEDPTKNGSSIAIFSVPRGSKKDENGNWVPNLITGPTIRFAEMALRYWGNFNVGVVPMGEDDKQCIYEVIATDYESNVTTSQIVRVPKLVEKTSNKDNLPVLRTRTNSYGKPVYLVEATEEEITMKANALISKARRNLILQAIPAWIIEDCIQQVRATAAKADAQNPAKAKEKLFAAFSAIGVTQEQLAAYIGHDAHLSQSEMETMRGLYSGIKEGATTWALIVAEKAEQGNNDDNAATIEKLFTELALAPAQVRNIKTKYVGNPDKLIEYLTAQVEKKRNDGGKKPEAKAEPVKEADTPTAQSLVQQTNVGSQAGTQETSKQAQSVEQTGGAKPGPVAVDNKAQVFEPEPEPTSFEGW